jgi:glycosyltransferase involved in cell wall biosynthesis
VALSDHVKRLLVEDYRYPDERIAVLPLGPFAYGDGVGSPRRFPRDRPFRFLFFGRLLAYKGLALLIEAFQHLTAAHAEVELFIVGQGDLGSYQESLTATPRVTVVNRWIDDDEIPGFLAEADVLVAPYTESSQSAAVAAAFGRGMPVVVTPVGGLAEQVDPGMTGIIASEPTATSVTEAMEAMLDPQLYERCAAAIHAQYVAIDPWRDTAEALVAHCRRITARATAAASDSRV